MLEQPRDSWIESKENLTNIQYLPNILGCLKKPVSYVCINVATNNWKSSMRAWLQLHYHNDTHKFQIFTIDPDGLVGADYLNQQDVKCIPYTSWIRNEILKLRLNSIGGRYIQPKHVYSLSLPKLWRVRGLDFANCLMKTLTEEDYVVVKMDVGGVQFQLMPKILNTSNIFLIDELFLECHYESPHKKYKDNRRLDWELLSLYGMLKDERVRTHQWWEMMRFGPI